MCLNSPTLPFLPCFITFCSTHSYTNYFYEIYATCSCTFFIAKVYFFYVDYGILYEEPLVRAKKHKSCCIYMIYVHVHTYIYVYVHVYVRIYVYFAFTYDDLFQQHGCIYSTRSVARFARPLYSMGKLNNNGSKARYSNRPSLIVI